LHEVIVDQYMRLNASMLQHWSLLLYPYWQLNGTDTLALIRRETKQICM